MRQFVTVGFWASLLALAVLSWGLVALARDDEPTVAPDAAPVVPEDREIDLIAMVFAAQADPGFDIVDGRASANMQVRVDGFRYMNIRTGTAGENRCADLAELASCAIAVDLLGEAVLWFSIVPLSPRNLVELPAPLGFRDGSKLQLANDWVVPHADVVRRDCDEDTTSLTDFMDRFGERATSVYSLDDQQIVRVVCTPDATVAVTTTLAVP
ncbi:MAG: hypothetical protein KDB40_03505 [Acidimicrobiales bacterium]|nr:hypothetical protein [Acidimicrobiales bacterium]MCB9392625.1 hypothetical protein [Acidimicrobiaceae bacterium]